MLLITIHKRFLRSVSNCTQTVLLTNADTRLRHLLFTPSTKQVLPLPLSQGRCCQARNSLVELLDASPVEIVQDDATRKRAHELGDRVLLNKIYDCTYAALANLRGVELWTADKRFCDSVSGALPFVKFIGNY